MKQRNHVRSAMAILSVGIFSMGGLFLGGVGGCGDSAGGGGGGGGGGSGNLASVTVKETSVGAGAGFTPAVSFFASDGGGLSFTVAGADINGDGDVGSPTISNVTIEAGDTIALALAGKRQTISNCATSGISGTSVDIGVSLDTTASMGAAAGILADRIAAFAQALEDAGADARFAGITTGDAFATKSDPSSFTDPISEGSLGAPPVFDFSERPDTGDGLLSADDMATFFTEVRAVVGSGASGGDLPENYLGPINYLNDSVAWRNTASRVLISIGDDCSHTNDSAASAGITDPWTPPSGAALESELSGVATVHVIGTDGLTCSSPFYNMEDLASGEFVPLGDCGSEDTCNVDLSELTITGSITGSATTACDIDTASVDEATLCFDGEIEGAEAFFCAVLGLVSE